MMIISEEAVSQAAQVLRHLSRFHQDEEPEKVLWSAQDLEMDIEEGNIAALKIVDSLAHDIVAGAVDLVTYERENFESMLYAHVVDLLRDFSITEAT